MEPLVRIEPGDAGALQMENELLRYEATHLRARLAAAEETAAKAQRTVERLREGKEGRDGGAPAADPARDDLVWLLTRLDRSPAGPLMRRYAGFRTLRERYLGQPGG